MECCSLTHLPVAGGTDNVNVMLRKLLEDWIQRSTLAANDDSDGCGRWQCVKQLQMVSRGRQPARTSAVLDENGLLLSDPDAVIARWCRHLWYVPMCMYASMYVCMYTHARTHARTHTYTHIYTYTHTHIHTLCSDDNESYISLCIRSPLRCCDDAESM